MYEITVEKHIDAAHYLRGYQGKCENLHGHRYRVVVKVRASKLNDIGIAYDFTDLKKHLGEVLERYDHTCLNDVKPFDKINPSAENLAATLYKEMKKLLSKDPSYAKASEGKRVKLTSVSVYETPEQGVTYVQD
jgi:6-pyruvoyltetrahydropterin/6-carboxytetrahydropterin synthase